MDDSQHLRLKWSNYPVAVSSSLESLRNFGDLVDTSLWCEGRQFKAHRVVLSACSHYFHQIFLEVSSPNVTVVLSNIPHQDVEAVLQFVYTGEVSLSEPQLASFLKTAEMLQIKGLGSANSVQVPAKSGETQLLAAALQKPLAKRATPPPLLSVYPSATPASLPSIDLGLAISNFTSNSTSSNSSASSSTTASTSLRKRKLAPDPATEPVVPKSEATEERNKEGQQHLVMVDMTPPNSIVTDDPNSDQHQRVDPLSLLPDRHGSRTTTDTASTARPYQSQCRGERPRNARVPYCPHCDEDCHNISVLRYHVKTVHSEPSGCLCCCFCTAVFNLHSSTEYKQHTLDTHGVKYT